MPSPVGELSAPTGSTLRGALRSLINDAAAGQVVTALNAAGVPSIVLKGASLTRWLYPDGGARSYIDCDVLVPSAQITEAGLQLEALGFSEAHRGFADSERETHASPWVRTTDGACVDLHQTIAEAGADTEVVWSVLATHTARMRIGGVECDVLDIPARACHVAMHAAHHGVGNDKSLADLVRALARTSLETWTEAADIAGRIGAAEAFATGLRLTEEGHAVAGQLGLPVSGSVTLSLQSTTPPLFAMDFAALHEMPRWRQRWSLLGRRLIPTPALMRAWYPLARRGRPGLCAAYAWRWIWLVRRVPPGYLAWRRARRSNAIRSDRPY